jgi:hypothetical protein
MNHLKSALNACLLMTGCDVSCYCKHRATSWLNHVGNITAEIIEVQLDRNILLCDWR